MSEKDNKDLEDNLTNDLTGEPTDELTENLAEELAKNLTDELADEVAEEVAKELTGIPDKFIDEPAQTESREHDIDYDVEYDIDYEDETADETDSDYGEAEPQSVAFDIEYDDDEPADEQELDDRALLKEYPTFSLDHVTTTNRKSGRHVLENTSMAFYAGSLYAVKMLADEEDAEQRVTLMAVLAGFQQPTSGAVMAKSSNITELEVNDLRGHRLGIITQRYAVRDDLDAESNVLYAMNASDRTFLKPKPVIARELLNRVGFREATKGRAVGGMSLLEQRRVAIARAISCEAETLILDEPTKGLDENDAATLLKLLTSIAHGRNPKRTVIIVTSSDDVAAVAEETYEL